MSDSLVQEFEVFKNNEARLQAEHPDKYILIKERDILGTYVKQYEAISEGYKRFGNEPFFIKQVVVYNTEK